MPPKVLDICLCLFVALVAQDGREFSDFSENTDIATTVACVLQPQFYDFDIMNEDKSTIYRKTSKAEKVLVRYIHI